MASAITQNPELMAAVSTTSTYLCTTTFFKNPNDLGFDPSNLNSGTPWKPYHPQVQLYNCLDYGFDVLNKVLKPTHPSDMIVMVWPRQYGKTEGVASTIAALMIRYSQCKIGVMSNNQENAKKLVDRIKFFLRNSPFADWITTDKTDTLGLKNGAICWSFGQTENIRGNSLWWLFVDEAAQFTEDLLDGAALPTVEAAGMYTKKQTPSIVLLSTPRGPVGKFYDYYVQGLEAREVGCRACGYKRELDHPDFETLVFPPRVMPRELTDCPRCGAHDYEYVANKITTITLDPYEHPLKTREMIDEKLRRRGNTPLARQELLGEIAMDDSGVFIRSWLDTAADERLHNNRKFDPTFKYSMGVDFGKMNDATVFTIAHSDFETHKMILDYIKVIPGQGGVKYTDIRKQLMELVAYYKPYILVMDSNGIGDPIVEQISFDIKDLQRIGVTGIYTRNGTMIPYEIKVSNRINTKIYANKKNREGFVFDYQTKLDLIDNLTNLFQMGEIVIPREHKHPDVRKMWKELINFGYTYSANNRIIYGTQRDHDDTVIALALVAWGLRQRAYIPMRTRLGGRNNFVF